jgi:recombination protein RecA
MSSEIDAIIEKQAAAAKKRGEQPLLYRGADLLDRRFLRATTGSLEFDLMLGGGWPLNGVNEVIGNESSGKTSMTLKTVAAQQAADPNYHTVWAASEDFDFGWAATLGVDASRMTFIMSNVMEEVFDACLEVMKKRAADAVIIDSLPALVPSWEAEKTMSEMTVGKGALLTNRFMRNTYSAAARSYLEYERPILCLVINQWRDTIVAFGDPRTTPGGRGKNFTYLTRVEATRDEWLKDKDKQVGQVIKCRTIKNKTAPPRRVGQVDFYFEDANGHFAGDYDTVREVYNLALLHGTIERHGAWFHFGDEKWNGKEAVWKAMGQDQALVDALDIRVRTEVLGQTPPAPASSGRKRSIPRS